MLCRLSLVAVSGGHSSLRCTGFSLWWPLLLGSMGSRRAGFSSCGSQALERRPSSCGARAQLLHGMWDLPGPGLEPVSPSLAGKFLTTAPPGKPWSFKSTDSISLIAIGLLKLSILYWVFVCVFQGIGPVFKIVKFVCSISFILLVFAESLVISPVSF